MKKKARNVSIDTKKLQKMATLKVENREKMTGKTLTDDEKNALIKRYVENPKIYFQSIPIKSKHGGRKKSRKMKKSRKSKKQTKKFRKSKRK